MALVMYERLERYDETTGTYKGAHVKLFDTETQRETDAISYSKAAALGFTQSDILTQIEAGAIAASDRAIADLQVSDNALSQAQQEISALRSENAALKLAADVRV